MSSLIAYRSLSRQKTRAILSVSGIVVGVGMILVLLSLAQGTQANTNNLIRGVVSAQLTVINSTTPKLSGLSGLSGSGQVVQIQCNGSSSNCPPPPSGSGSGQSIGAVFLGSPNTIPESDIDKIQSLYNVYAATPELSISGYLDNNSIALNGIVPSTFTEVTSGISITSGHMLNSTHQIILNSVLASNLGASLGSTVIISYNALNSTNKGSTFTVVGIYSAGSTFGPAAGTVYIELSDAQSLSNKTGLVSEIDVKTNNPSQTNSVKSEILNAISSVTVNTGSGVISEEALSSSLAIFFIMIGLVALLAGAFGVTNTMILSVSERTKEIGTLRALGAEKSQVLRIVLTESLLVGVVGAAGGAFIGIIVSYIIPYFSGSIAKSGLGGLNGLLNGQLATSVTASNVILCTGLGIIVGILAGIYPALRAARLSPVEALKHD